MNAAEIEGTDNTHPIIPSVNGLITLSTVERALDKKFTHPLCSVIETNKGGVLRVLQAGLEEHFKSQKHPSLVSNNEITNFIESVRGEILLEQVVENQRDTQIKYWENYITQVESGTFNPKYSLSKRQLLNIGKRQLHLLGVLGNENDELEQNNKPTSGIGDTMFFTHT